METITRTPQTIWDCRWSRLRRPRSGVEARVLTDPGWVCVRHPGQRRSVTDPECEECGYWDTRDPAGSAEGR